MIPLVILKKLKLDNSDNIVKVIIALITVVILSKDLGLEYTNNEKKIYTNPFIQSIAVFCIAYQMLNEWCISVLILGLWLFIKYFDNFSIKKVKN